MSLQTQKVSLELFQTQNLNLPLYFKFIVFYIQEYNLLIPFLNLICFLHFTTSPMAYSICTGRVNSRPYTKNDTIVYLVSHSTVVAWYCPMWKSKC